MVSLIAINKNKKQPIYLQIVESIKENIKAGVLHSGEQLPSINQVANEFDLARETVVKAFHHLQEKGIINAIHGKGYFVLSEDIKTEHRVFLLFDTFSAYKEVVYNAIIDGFGENAVVDIYFHHFNSTVFAKLVSEAVGNYTSYIILPFDSPEIIQSLKSLPSDKVYILDQKPNFILDDYPSVYQDFYADIYGLLNDLGETIRKYQKLVLVFRNTNTKVPFELKDGFEKFCQDKKVNYEITEKSLIGTSVEKGNGYLVIDDEDLVHLVDSASSKDFEIGKELGIISYNETSLKKVVAGGISVISTDFYNMGSQVVEMIKNEISDSIKNPCRFIDRKSF